MARELIVAWAGRRQRDEWEKLCGGYRRRIRRQWPVRDLPVRVRLPAGAVRERRRAEGKALLEALPDPCWKVALEPGGRQLRSQELARWLQRLLDRWPHPVAFLLGSDIGLGTEVRRSAEESLSLGPLTLPHNLARLVLYEQLYRAAAIRAGVPYDR